MRRFTILAAALALASAACGGSGGGPKDAAGDGRDGAAGDGGDGKAGAGAGTTGGAGTGGAGTAGGAGTGAAGTGAASIPGSQIKKLVTGAVALVGSGTDTCTSLPGATTDRWCGFLRQSALTNAIELWVVDVTALVAGGPVTCDGTSASCKRLSQTAFFDDQGAGAGVHRFYGDTLIYLADAGAGAANGFVGTIWAWRPGWTAGRKLTSPMGNDCTASTNGDAIACLQGAAEVVAGELSVDILAGVPPAADDTPLPLLERTVIAAIDDAQGVNKFQLNFTADGSYVAWSSRAKGSDPETLKVQKLSDPASRQTVTTDVSVWEITADGKSWLWLRGFNYNPAAPSGTLESAPFPAGTTPATLASGIATYRSFAGGSVLLQTATGSELRRMPDRTIPTTTQLLDQGIAGVLDFSDDASKVVYAKDFDANGLIDIWVRDVAAAAPCKAAAPSTAVPTATLFGKAGTVLWARLDNSGLLQGMATSVASCQSTPFATNVLRWIAAGDDALTILDDTAPTADDSTLRYSKVDDGVLPARGTALQTHVTGIYGPLVPTLPAVLYTGATAATAGLYVYMGPPLGALPTPPGDGGAMEAGTDATTDVADGGTDAVDAADTAADTTADDATDGN
jgi:hypothetical protein